jgi:hypothetical protein
VGEAVRVWRAESVPDHYAMLCYAMLSKLRYRVDPEKKARHWPKAGAPESLRDHEPPAMSDPPRPLGPSGLNEGCARNGTSFPS